MTVGGSSGRFAQAEALAAAERQLVTDPHAALAAAKRILRAIPDPSAHRLVAAACRRIGRTDEAEEAELSAIHHGMSLQLRGAVAAAQGGRHEQARALAEQVLRRQPDDLLALTIAAEAALHSGDVPDAEAMLATVIGRAPGFLRGSVVLSNLLAGQLRLREAVAIIEAYLERTPDDVTALARLADLHGQLGDYAAAADCLAHLLAIDPKHATHWIRYAQNIRALGKPDESLQALRRALSLQPSSGAAWWAIAHYFPDAMGDHDLEALGEAVTASPDASAEAGLLRLALATVLDHRGEHEAAFCRIADEKARLAATRHYDPDLLTADIDQLLAQGWTVPAVASSDPSDPRPIFIVGMPRSGSTLVERMLGQHSRIEAAGELQLLPRVIAELPARAKTGNGLTAAPNAVPAEWLRRMAGWYIDRSRQFRRAGKLRFVDKHNGNWLHAGLIPVLFPHARILDVRRCALDCCWSNYRTMFGDPHADDLRSLARYYRDYARYIDALAARAPTHVLQVSYEALVDDPNGQLRRICRFLDLPFERQCLSFHLSPVPVATPSSEQVRRPLNREGIGAAEPYRTWLGPLIEDLGLIADRT